MSKKKRQKGSTDSLSRLSKKLMMDELIYGVSIYKSSEGEIRRVDPISDEGLGLWPVKEMTREEILDKYGKFLSEDEIKRLNQNKEDV